MLTEAIAKETYLFQAYNKFFELISTKHLDFNDVQVAQIAAQLTIAFSVQGIENAADTIIENLQES